MTSDAVPQRRTPGFGTLTYARSRLYLGMTGVGTVVLMAIGVLAFDIPATAFANATEHSLARALIDVGLVFAMTVLLLFPFDLLGGVRLVRHRTGAVRWLLAWGRGVLLQWLVWMGAAAALLTAARMAGTMGTLAVFIAVQLLLAVFRGRFARLIASFTVHPPSSAFVQAAERAGLEVQHLLVVDGPDEGFVGGWSGLLPRTLVVPRRWEQLPPHALAAQLARRALVAERGAHWRGVVGAIVWNTVGFLIVQQLTGTTPATAAGLITLAAGMTLWAFLGVLLLPTPSRAAVYAADTAVAARMGAEAVRVGIERLDQWQDDEPTRSPIIERIFHPVPARTHRLANLTSGGASGLKPWHTHHLARHALWLGWGSFSLVSRAVHCNVGRPALWAMLPGD